MEKQRRSLKIFIKSSDRSKLRKTMELRKNTDLYVLTFAIKTKFEESGKEMVYLVFKTWLVLQHELQNTMKPLL